VLPNDRRDEDDTTRATFDHVLQRRLSHVERTGQVHFENRAPVILRHLQGHLVHGDDCIVDQDVEPPVLVEHFLDHPAAVLRLGDVALVDRGSHLFTEALIELGHELLRPSRVRAVSSSDRGPLGSQAPTDRGPDAAGPTSDECNPASELVTDKGRLFNGCRGSVDGD